MSAESDALLASLQSQVVELAAAMEQQQPLQAQINDLQGQINALQVDPTYINVSNQISALNNSVQSTSANYIAQLLQDGLGD